MLDKKIAYLEVNCDSELPNIETVVSFSPTSSCSSSCSNSRVVTSFEDAPSTTTSTDDSGPSTFKPTRLEPLETTNHGYISKHELELLLTPQCLGDYETMAEEEETNVLAERAVRKQLIRQELETLMILANDENELLLEEPETIEALGIAANQVAYLQKYYDVASCKYIYVPSMAYTILDGSLLREAAKHYYGSHSRQEFVTAHAAGLRATIVAGQKLGIVPVESLKLPPSGLTEDLDLGDDETNVLAERAFRKQLIRQELETLMTLANDENELLLEEPETIEALGIAANQVAYLQKYYDVASCKYIYVPSVAYTILDWSLLREAAKHYYGSRSRQEFVTAHAAGLRATIVAGQKLGIVPVESLKLPPSDLREDLDLGDDVAIDYHDGDYDEASLANMVWGVSPTHDGGAATRSSSFAWEQEDVPTRKPSLSSLVKRGLPVILLLLMVGVGSMVIGLDNVFGVSFQSSVTERIYEAQTSPRSRRSGRRKPIVPNLLY
jgi:ferritin-like protein